MKRLLLIIWFGSSMLAWSQTDPPIWVKDVYRKINYPPEKWHTGYVQDRLKENEDANSALKKMERDAISHLAETIITTVEIDKSAESAHRPARRGLEALSLVNLDVNSYYDPSTGMLYAFAAIKRDELANYFLKQINANLRKAETTIDVTKQQLVAAKKSSARKEIKEAGRLLEEIRLFRSMIDISNVQLKDKDLQAGREDELQRAIEKIMMDFDTDIVVYIDCRLEPKGASNDAFEKDPGIFCGIITQALTEKECFITDNKNNADFILTLITSTTLRSDGKDAFGIISYYANVKGSLYSRTENKHIIDFVVANDSKVYAAGRTPEDAAIKAFKLPALKNMILEKILPEIIN